jgi:hypothetical protein
MSVNSRNHGYYLEARFAIAADRRRRSGFSIAGAGSAMKQVKFDNSLSLQQAYPGRPLPPVIELEGWLVDDHICVQKPNPQNDSDWRVTLYPWGHILSFDFYTRADATEFAIDASKLGVDWKFIYSLKAIGRSFEYKQALAQIRALRRQYEADGFFKPLQSLPLVAAVRR